MLLPLFVVDHAGCALSTSLFDAHCAVTNAELAAFMSHERQLFLSPLIAMTCRL
jgi:hypothetical protein